MHEWVQLMPGFVECLVISMHRTAAQMTEDVYMYLPELAGSNAFYSAAASRNIKGEFFVLEDVRISSRRLRFPLQGTK